MGRAAYLELNLSQQSLLYSCPAPILQAHIHLSQLTKSQKDKLTLEVDKRGMRDEIVHRKQICLYMDGGLQWQMKTFQILDDAHTYPWLNFKDKNLIPMNINVATTIVLVRINTTCPSTLVQQFPIVRSWCRGYNTDCSHKLPTPKTLFLRQLQNMASHQPPLKCWEEKREFGCVWIGEQAKTLCHKWILTCYFWQILLQFQVHQNNPKP